MHPFSIEFHFSDLLIFKIIAAILALFVVAIWFYYNKHVNIVKRIVVGIIGGVASYFVVMLFFGVIQSFYTTVSDNLSSDVTRATIEKYDVSTSTYLNSKSKMGSSKKRRNTFYKPLLKVEVNGKVERGFGDVSFSKNNLLPVGTQVDIIKDGKEFRMISPLKTFAFVMNVVVLIFLLMFYFLFFTYAKYGSFEGVFPILGLVFIFALFPIAFCVLIFIFLSFGYEYFILHERNISLKAAIFFTGMGIFLLLCLYGYIKHFFEDDKKGKKKRMKNRTKKVKKLKTDS